jgi:hypothetical protein
MFSNYLQYKAKRKILREMFLEYTINMIFTMLR